MENTFVVVLNNWTAFGAPPAPPKAMKESLQITMQGG